jgi:glutamate synthase domain-containing protein 3
LAGLGLRSFDDAIGRVELLRQRTVDDPRADSVDLSPLLHPPADPAAPRRFVEGRAIQRPRSALGDRLAGEAYRALWEGEDLELAYAITNGDRSVGAALSGAVALEFGDRAPRGRVRARFDGEAGQSFGAFLAAGVTLELVGEANDYVGKAMGAGRVVIRPPADDVTADDGYDWRAWRPVLAGNTCLYGATGGELFVAGMVGERFGVRNSGALAVVEGVGDHACEYMTGGTVVVLGSVGYNFGAGMTGGQAFIWDPRLVLGSRINTSLVEMTRPETSQLEELRWLVEQHVALTSSQRASALLAEWTTTAEWIWYVAPVDRVRRMQAEQAGRVGVSS